ncbi:hypothetical protein DZA65_01000 [Dickeya dianthicola]|uniref:SUN domain-containing protein n=1 Tax=Dickeya dianthicola TaxID=204039 RepID=A0ABX9NR96_9GAMM|nr:hypothetical protein [Dickeya dianthicola]AYC17905.1 hypothetical protein DZA65_01000 [Dickeya dianthicola]MBI0438115.1 hypothetical protein [Dickeya dianthicola]MBI0448337.1 hypothetical protein [Dickeya dianthicola]MBI0452998.1 hypothetical protein [Dickeya dianthicola]MBI0457441.1 hypothetical protein [Dickeya dianthicola]
MNLLDKKLKKIEQAIHEFESEQSRFNSRVDAVKSEFEKNLRTAHSDIEIAKIEFELACVKSWGGVYRSPPENDECWRDICPEWPQGTQPDLAMIIQPPYRGFCRHVLIRFAVDCGLACDLKKWDGSRYHLVVRLRHPPSRYQFPWVLRGISAFSKVMPCDRNGYARLELNSVSTINFQDVKLCIVYIELLVSPKTGESKITLEIGSYLFPGISDIAHDGTKRITLKFPNVREAYLHLIAVKYRSWKFYRKIYEG